MMNCCNKKGVARHTVGRCIKMTKQILNGVVVLEKKFLPASLAMQQVPLFIKVFKCLVVGVG